MLRPSARRKLAGTSAGSGAQDGLELRAQGPAGQGGDGADVLVVAQGVRGTPLAVGVRLGGVGDLGVGVQLHVAVPGGVLEPVRGGQVGFVPLAGLAAADAVWWEPVRV
jgi:hypothetical protein